MLAAQKNRLFESLALVALTLIVSACGKPHSGTGVLATNSNDPFAAFGHSAKTNLQVSNTPPAAQDLPTVPVINPAHDHAPTVSEDPRPAFTAAWDKLGAKGAQWTTFTADALETYGGGIIASNPSDIQNYCPNYSNLSYRQREDFWIKMISGIASAESDFDAKQSFDEKRKIDSKSAREDISRGLMQISLEDNHRYGCNFQTVDDTFDPQRNLECGIKIIASMLSQEPVISLQLPIGKWHGLSVYWGTLHPADKRHVLIMNALATATVCQTATSASAQ